MSRPLCFAEGPLKRIGNSRFGPWPVQGTEEATEGGGRPISGEGEARRRRGRCGGGRRRRVLPAGGSIGVWGGRRWRVGGAGVAAAAVSGGGDIPVAVRGRKQADEHHRGERKVLACLVWVLGRGRGGSTAPAAGSGPVLPQRRPGKLERGRRGWVGSKGGGEADL